MTQVDPAARDALDAVPLPRSTAPLTGVRKPVPEMVALYLIVGLPFLALVAAIPLAWGRGLGWRDIVLTVAFYALSGVGVSIGLHRYLTHGSFKAKRPLRIALACAASTALEGPVIPWVAHHRRHHAFSDREGDPHSPWRYGETIGALLKGLVYAHVGWLFEREHTNWERFAPDLLADPDIRRVEKQLPLWMAVSLFLPPLLGGLWSMSFAGALTAFFWASLVRLGLSHHVTWSINSICHTIGERPFAARDKSANFWPLAILSFGESWHNSHHADPTCARHGVLRGQIDISARIIALFERLGWAYDVRWSTPERIAARVVTAGGTTGTETPADRRPAARA